MDVKKKIDRLEAQIAQKELEKTDESRAAKRVILTAEMIVGDGFFSRNEVKADIPHFMVSHVVRARLGAFPGSCFGAYGPDDRTIRKYAELENADGLRAMIGEGGGV